MARCTRDALALRQKLCVLACLPTLALACSEPPKPSAEKAQAARAGGGAVRSNPKPKADSKPDSKPDPKADAKAEGKAPKGPRINEAPPPPPLPTDPEELRLMPVQGDPPWIDGYNPEEDPCPSGNWCGTIESATLIAPKGGEPQLELGCPTRVIGAHYPSPIKGPKYKGLSKLNGMQGSLNQHGTELARADGKDDACCYHWFEYCSGRPLVDDGAVCTATSVPRTDWADLSCPASSPIREALGEAWLRDAEAEHASVAAFARVAQELMAVGAPPDLLRDTLHAATDEVQHTQACYGMANRFTTRIMGPGALPCVTAREPSLVQVAVDALVEGCVGETTAALVAERAAAVARDEVSRQTQQTIAEDEARHAAVAWRTVRWALQQGGGDVAIALRLAFDSLPMPTAEPTPSHAHWNRYGRLSQDQQDAAARDTRRDIVGPMLEALLASVSELPASAEADDVARA